MESTKKLITRRNLIGLLALVFGPAIYEQIGKPFISVMGRFVLTISSLTINKFDENLYLNIAQNNHEYYSIKTLYFIYATIAAIYTVFLLRNFLFRFERKLLRKEKKQGHLLSLIFRIRPNFALNILVFMMIGYNFFQMARINYINSAVTYYNQSILIIKPYITSDEYNNFNSRFAQISNRGDFFKLVSEIKGVSDNKHVTLPLEPNFTLLF